MGNPPWSNIDLQCDERINIWLKANKLTVNIKKTHYMMFHRTRIKHNLRNITICDMNVTCTKNTKFLGVIIDNKLRWSDHINYIKNKISKSIGIINKTRNFLNKKYFKKSLLYLYLSISHILHRDLGEYK